MRLTMIRRTFLSLFPVCAMFIACGSASASPVTIVGGFTGYVGQTACGAFTTLIDGQDKTGSGPTCIATPPNIVPLQPLSFTFPTTSSVDFSSPTIPPFVGNNVAFTPSAGVDVASVGDEFLLGTLTYTNGTWITTGAGAAQFTFSLTTSSSNSSLNGATLSDSLILDITPNDFVTNTPAQNADTVRFSSVGGNQGSLPVFELLDSPTGSNIGSAHVYGRIVLGTGTAGFSTQNFGSEAVPSLVVTRLADYSGGTPDATAAVPEPGTMVLMGTGLAAVLARVRRRS
jgi:hypothetical protein